MFERIQGVVRQAALNWLFPPNPSIVGFSVGEDGVPPFRKHKGDAGWDIFTSKLTQIPANSFRDVPTSLFLDMPDGVWCRITGRSSTIRKWGVETVGDSNILGLEVIEGIIDTGYTGELFVSIINHSSKVITIEKGDRLAQLTFQRHVDIGWQMRSVNRFRNSTRGTDGFGSTGRNGNE